MPLLCAARFLAAETALALPAKTDVPPPRLKATLYTQKDG